jgi:nitrogen fixation/metabolism regulation signal transduction histidine kinase
VAELERPIRTVLLPAALVARLAALLAAAAGAVLAGLRVRPILHLQQAAARLAHGSLQEQVTVDRCDELEELVGAFNSMASELQARLAELGHRNQELAPVQRMDRQMLAGAPLEEILNEVVRASAELAGAAACFLLQAGPEGKTLPPVAVHAPTH